jgi:predicted outer membrane repeat protein
MTQKVSVSDAPNCGITYACHYDDSGGVIYAQSISITLLGNTYSTGIINIIIMHGD